MRIRSVAVVVRDQRVLVIDRVKDGRHYCVLPGGGVEQGETPREACKRELFEETSLEGKVGELIDIPIDGGHSGGLLRCPSGLRNSHRLRARARRASELNRYEPTWVDLEAFPHFPLVPDAARRAAKLLIDR